jgi:DNA (cytosine-5)-methyltransferase 1
VFVVASARAGFNPAEVLFEFDGLRRDSAPSREKRKDAAASTGSSAKIASGKGNNLEQNKEVAKCLTAGVGQRYDFETETFILEPIVLAGNTIGRQAHNGGNGNGFDESGICYTLTTADVHGVFKWGIDYENNAHLTNQATGPLLAGSRSGGGRPLPAIVSELETRRLTPTECERLQGFPDGHTLIPWRGKLANDCPDSPRYKALGNSMAVPVMRWIGKRIDEALKQ